MTEERFTITLQANRSDTRPAPVRLRGLLKVALRAFGLRCVTINPAPTTDTEKLIDDRPRK